MLNQRKGRYYLITTASFYAICSHQEELDNLQNTDPEFFKFLQENDSSLLDFKDVPDSEDEDDDADMNDTEESDEEDVETKPLKRAPKDPVMVETTIPLVDELMRSAIEKGSLAALKKIISIFRSACFPAAEDDEEDGPSSRFHIPTPDIYEHVMLTVIEKLHSAFYFHLQLTIVSKLSTQQIEQIEKHSKWKSIKLLVMSFFKSVMHTLTNLAESATQFEISSYLIYNLEPYIPLLAPFQRLSRNLLKTLLQFWSTGPSPDQDSTNIRGYSFLRIRQMCLTLPGVMMEESFRSIYLTFVRTCKTYNESNEKTITFMSQCITELYQCDLSQAYQNAFLYIRQLSLYLRTALINQTPETIKNILSWQYINSLRLWTRVLCSMSLPNELGPLIFPLVQIMLGLLTSASSTLYIPLKFHIIICLQQLAAYGETFIPTSVKLLDILENTTNLTSHVNVSSTEVPPLLQHIFKFSHANQLDQQRVKDVIVKEIVDLLKSDIEIYRYHVSLPEYLYIILKKIKAFIKKVKNNHWKDLFRALVNHFIQYSNSVKKERADLKLSPLTVVGFEPLKPSSAASSSQRLTKIMASVVNNNNLSTVSEIIVNTNSTKKLTAPSMSPARNINQQNKTSNTGKTGNKSKAGQAGEGDDSDDEGEGDVEEGDDDFDEDGDEMEIDVEGDFGSDDEEEKDEIVISNKSKNKIKNENKKMKKKQKKEAKSASKVSSAGFAKNSNLDDEVQDLDWSDDDSM